MYIDNNKIKVITKFKSHDESIHITNMSRICNVKTKVYEIPESNKDDVAIRGRRFDVRNFLEMIYNYGLINDYEFWVADGKTWKL